MYCCYLSSVAKIGVEARERPSAAEVGLTIVFTLVHELRSFLCKGTEKFVLQVDIHRLWHRIYLFRIPAFAGLSRPLVRVNVGGHCHLANAAILLLWSEMAER